MKALLVAAVLSVTAATAFADEPAITVTGEASVNAVPDIATIEGGVAMDAKTAREAGELANSAMGKVLLALKAAGLAEADVKTQRLSLQPTYQPRNNGASQVVSGYRASNQVSVRLRDMTLIAPVLDAMVAAGANEISGVSFRVEKPSALLDEARSVAMTDARRKAEIYAKAAGVTLGAPLAISEDGASAPVFAKRAMSAMSAAPTPVLPGEETLRVGVTVTWAIEK